VDPFRPHLPSLGAGLPVEYLRGYRDAVNHLVDKVLAGAGLPGGMTEEALAAAFDESELTWGLQATKAAASQFSGKGVRVAVLDTGLDLGHPDFVGRQVVAKSFVPNQEVHDGHGHGTHCIGTACGPRQPGQLPRYGVAFDAEIFAGKVLSDQGGGADGGILAGINWALTNGCPLISMSLGAPVLPGQGFSRIFEQVARRGLAAGTLIIAAAGNESERPGFISPVGHPANCPSITAVAALDTQLRVAPFSNGGLNPQGGQVDLAGPGVRVRSSWPRPTLYHAISGTSMATPHVTGIAALLAEANPETRGRALANLLVQSARRLTLPARDVGAGLVQAPQEARDAL
jgi:subtilisin